MARRERKYVWVNREYFNTGMKPLDILILSRIEEDNMHGRFCELTNDELADMFGETTYAVKQSLSKLERMGMISKRLYYVKGRGRGNRQRDLMMNNEVGKRLCEKRLCEKRLCEDTLRENTLYEELENGDDIDMNV